MKVHIAWPIFFVLVTVFVLGVLLYQQSRIPAYSEAEPLFSTVAEFGQSLAEKKSNGAVSASSIEALIMEERFETIQSYGIIFSKNPEVLVTIRVNHKFSFDITLDGQPRWNIK